MDEFGKNGGKSTLLRYEPRRQITQDPCLEGVAEVTSRKRRKKSASEIAAARETLGARGATSESAAAPHFGRRKPAAGTSKSPDLVWSSMSVSPPNRSDSSRSPQDSAVNARLQTKRLTPARLGVLAASFAFGLALLPTFLLSFPEAPVAATVFGTATPSPVRLFDVSASMSERGDGKVLTITGVVENRGKAVAVIPAIRIDFENPDGRVNSRMLRTAVATLDPNQRVDIVSMIAMPAWSDGEVKVGFLETVRKGKP